MASLSCDNSYASLKTASDRKPVSRPYDPIPTFKAKDIAQSLPHFPEAVRMMEQI